MNEDKLSATASGAEAGDAARRATPRVDFEQTGGRATAATTRTVGVYARPAQRTRLSLPFILIMILAVLVSVVVTARFLF